MRHLILEEPFSRPAKWSPMLAWFALAVSLLAVLLIRFNRIDYEAGFLALGAGLAVAFIAAGMSLIAFIRIWQEGRRGLSSAIKGLVLASLVLAYPAWLAVKAVTLPPINDIATDTDDPPAFSRSRAALEALTTRLKKAAGLDAQVDVAVLDSKIPNAIALPGGRIHLFRGLLDRADSVDEIAGVLSHEMGHVAHRDSLRGLIHAGGASYLLSLLFGDVTGGGSIVLVSRILIDNAHSREAEMAADDFSAKAMLASGRSPGPMGLLLKRIEGNERKLPAFLSTHPVTDQRLQALQKQVPSRPGAPLLDDEEWRALKEICKTT
jgi:Zn-dependent protease with chaperone function